MGLSIISGGLGLTLLNNYSRVNRGIEQATTRLSTGLRINSGRDDPAGLIGAAQLRGDLVDITARLDADRFERSQLHVQQSGRQNAVNVLQDLRGEVLSTTGTFSSDEQRAATQQQIDSALDAVSRLGAVTGFDYPAELEALRSGGDAEIRSGDTAAAVELLDQQIDALTQANAAAGTHEKYTLDVDQRIAEDQSVIIARSLSQQEDAVFAEETSNLVKGQILDRASIKTIALAQRIRAEGIGLLFDTLSR
jgi:flagellin-like hook-associated protein FlgL